MPRLLALTLLCSCMIVHPMHQPPPEFVEFLYQDVGAHFADYVRKSSPAQKELALLHAQQCGNVVAMETLIKQGARITDYQSTFSCTSPRLTWLLTQGTPSDWAEYMENADKIDKDYALQYAARHRNSAAMIACITHGAHAYEYDAHVFTNALRTTNPTLINLLLRRYALVDEEALDYLCSRGLTRYAATIVAKLSNVDLQRIALDADHRRLFSVVSLINHYTRKHRRFSIPGLRNFHSRNLTITVPASPTTPQTPYSQPPRRRGILSIKPRHPLTH